MLMFEFKDIVLRAVEGKAQGLASVLVTVVHLEGSSYRRPGVRMLVLEDGTMCGAVSGGCVEKEIRRRANEVFQKNQPLIMTYDGRYRLGCEGILHILIEPFTVSDALFDVLNKHWENRLPVRMQTTYIKEEGCIQGARTVLNTESESYNFYPNDTVSDTAFLVLEQRLDPAFRLVIAGVEHDAVILSQQAYALGWEVHLLAPPDDPRQPQDFRYVHTLHHTDPATWEPTFLDDQTALILMTHSLAKDFQFLLKLQGINLAYLGILGPVRRREKLFSHLLEHQPETDPMWLEAIYAPAGLQLGAETPHEIALSVLSEIVLVRENGSGRHLKEVRGAIHNTGVTSHDT